jgi:hypothetical protein
MMCNEVHTWYRRVTKKIFYQSHLFIIRKLVKVYRSVCVFELQLNALYNSNIESTVTPELKTNHRSVSITPDEVQNWSDLCPTHVK